MTEGTISLSHSLFNIARLVKKCVEHSEKMN